MKSSPHDPIWSGSEEQLPSEIGKKKVDLRNWKSVIGKMLCSRSCINAPQWTPLGEARNLPSECCKQSMVERRSRAPPVDSRRSAVNAKDD